MQKIIIDTDPGIDDAIAILLALSAKQELEVLALTTVNGNVGLDKVTKNAFRILEIAGRNDIPVYKGSAEPLAGCMSIVKHFMEMTDLEICRWPRARECRKKRML